MQERCFFENKSGFKIAAIFSKPETDTSDSIVILCHGLDFSKNSRVNMALERIFLKNNISVFQLDFFGHGESQGSKDDANVAEFVDNVLTAIKFVKNLHYKHIGIYGASFGAVVSVIAASKNSDLRVMALKAPGMGPTTRTLSRYKPDFDGLSWIKAGKKVRIPTLIVQGTSDEKVEVRFCQELADSIKGCRFELYPGADHNFTKREDFDRMVHDISEFIMAHIPKKEGKAD